MGGFIERIVQDWEVLKRAPGAFLILLAGGLAVGFAGGMVWRGQEVAVLENLMRLKDEERQFSERQLSDIKSGLKVNPSSVDIIGGKRPDDPRVDQLKNVFKDSGWSVGVGQPSPDVTTSLVLRTADPKAASTIEKTLKDAGVGYQMATPSGKTGTDFLLSNSK